MVDLAIVGRLGDNKLLGGMAIGTAIFNFLYWNFGFLRMGTSGFTAQAYGARDFGSSIRTLLRALTVAVGISIVILLLQVPLESLALGFMDGSNEVEREAARYFYVRVWAAPATLSLYAFKGWFVGMQNARTPMWIAILINIVNILMSLLMVYGFGMGIAGVALGTVVAQWSGVAAAAWILWRYYGRLFKRSYFNGLLEWSAMRGFFRVNRDIFLRTICLVAVFTYFTAASSTMGDDVLAANTLILQLFTLFSYLMDGFAYSGEALAGRYFGAGNRVMLHRAVLSIFGWGAVVALLFTIVYGLFAESILWIFTDDSEVLAVVADYSVWATALPLAGFMAFLLDGILVGITASGIMRNSMFVATALFFGLFLLLRSSLGNDALWISFLVYLFARGVVQFICSYRLILR